MNTVHHLRSIFYEPLPYYSLSLLGGYGVIPDSFLRLRIIKSHRYHKIGFAVFKVLHFTLNFYFINDLVRFSINSWLEVNYASLPHYVNEIQLCYSTTHAATKFISQNYLFIAEGNILRSKMEERIRCKQVDLMTCSLYKIVLRQDEWKGT